MKNTLATVFIGAFFLLSAGCTPNASHFGERGVGSTLTLAAQWEPKTMNPLLLNGSEAAEIDSLIFSYLLNVDNAGYPVPDVASTVPTLKNGGISADGMTIRYRLRRNVRWSDGVPLTAQDVIFSYTAIMNPQNLTGSREGYDEIRSINAPDPYTVVLKLKQPYSPILLTFFAPNQNYAILPAHLLASYPSLNRVSYNSNPVGSGPYELERWLHGDRMVFVRNPHYFGKRPAIQRIVLKFIPQSETILTQLQTGEIDGTLSADPAIAPYFGSLHRSRVLKTPIPSIGAITFNVHDPILSDSRVRRAFAMALDRESIVSRASDGVRNDADAMRGLFEWAYDPSVRYPQYDARAAAQLLDSAGWRLGSDGVRRKNGAPLRLQILYPAGSAIFTRLVTQIQQKEAAVGIAISVRSEVESELFDTKGELLDGRFQIALNPWINGADPELVWFFGCAQRAPGGFNIMEYCSPVVDRAEEAGMRTFDRAQRVRDYATVQEQLARDLPLLPLYQDDEIDVIPNRLRGFTPSAEGIRFQNVQNWSLGAN